MVERRGGASGHRGKNGWIADRRNDRRHKTLHIPALRPKMLIRPRRRGMILATLRAEIGLNRMRRPVVGVIGNAYRIENRFATQMVGERNLRAVAEVAGALPLMFAGAPDITDIGALLDVVDGVVLTG